MCGGPSGTQAKLQSEEADFYAQQMDAYNKAYSKYSDLTDAIQKQFAPILAKGPDQYGYTPTEDAALRTQATEGTASYYTAAQRALAERTGAMGGGTSNVNQTSGAAEAERARLATTAAGTEAQQNLGITTSGYDLGRQMWSNAMQGTTQLAGMWNPNQFASSTVNAGQLASSEANTIAQQQQSAWGSVLGALGGVAGAAMGNPAAFASFGRPSAGGGGSSVGGFPTGIYTTTV